MLPSPYPGSAAGHPASHRLVRKEATPHSPDQGPQPSDSAEVSTCQRHQAQPHALPQTEPAPHRPQCPAPQPLQWVWPSAPLGPSPGPQRRHSHSFPLHFPARDTPSWKPSSHLLDGVGNSGQGPSPVDASSGLSPRPPRAGRVSAPGVLPSQATATSALLQPHAPPPPRPGRPAQPTSRPHGGAHAGPGRRDLSRPRLALCAACTASTPPTVAPTPTPPGLCWLCHQADKRGADPQEDGNPCNSKHPPSRPQDWRP